jgi:hypothetical protein
MNTDSHYTGSRRHITYQQRHDKLVDVKRKRQTVGIIAVYRG